MRISKGNLYRDIPDEKLTKYQNDGWEQVGADGKKIKAKQKEAAAKIAELEAAVEEKDKTIAAQAAKIAELEAAAKPN